MSRSSGVAAGGGGGGLANAYAAVTDGVNTATAVGADTLLVESTDTNIVRVAADGAPDTLDLTLNNVVRVGAGQVPDWLAEIILGDDTFIATFADIVLTQTVGPPDTGAASLSMYATDSTGSAFAQAILGANADGTTGNASASLQLNDGTNSVQFQCQNPLGAGFFLQTAVPNGLGNFMNIIDTGIGATVWAVDPTAAMVMRNQVAPGPLAGGYAKVYAHQTPNGGIELVVVFTNGQVAVLATDDIRSAQYILPVQQTAVGNLAVAGTSLFSVSAPPAALFPANSLRVGDIIRITAAGELFNNSGGAAVMQVLVRIGGQTVCATTNTSIATGAGSTRQWTIEADYEVQALGVLLASRFQGREFCNISGAGNNNIVLANTFIANNLASFNTTAAAALDVLCASSVNNAATTASLESIGIQVIRGSD